MIEEIKKYLFNKSSYTNFSYDDIRIINSYLTWNVKTQERVLDSY